MKEKCEWSDGEFVACCQEIGLIDGDVVINAFYGYYRGSEGIPYSFCPFCGADIRKPEPKVIIKKDGGTFVARYNGVDYLLLDSSICEIKYMSPEGFEREIRKWKPISDIEITDEIAKLRPMVKFAGSVYQLFGVVRRRYGIIETVCSGVGRVRYSGLGQISLATVDDLP